MERYNGLNIDTLYLVDRLLTDNPLHIMRLRHVYKMSEQIIRELNWQDISTISKPRVLLCGTGSPTTTLEYTNHARRYNPDVQIAVLDLSVCRLYRSKEKLGQVSSINYVQADTIHLPFDDNSFDRVETDRILQFFSTEEKKWVIAEWKRILKPGGVITTREHLVTAGNAGEKVLDDIFKLSLRKLGVKTYPTTTVELKNIFSELGFDYSVRPFLIQERYGVQMPLNKHIVAKRVS